MALDSNGPKAEIDRVIKLYEATTPRAYLSVSPDKLMAAPMVGGMPVWPHRQTMAAAVKWAEDYNSTPNTFLVRRIRLDVGWCGSTGKWVALEQIPA